MTDYLIFGISYSFACVIQPGPFQAFLFSQSLANGWKKTIPVVFAPLLSDLPVITVVVFALTRVPRQVLNILQALGGLFLLFLAFKAYKSFRTAGDSTKTSGSDNLFKAVIVNLLNPNPWLGWSLVMGPMLLRGWQSNPENGIVLIISFYGSMIIFSILLTGLFAFAGNLGPAVKRFLTVISVLAFLSFGFYELWMGLAGFFS